MKVLFIIKPGFIKYIGNILLKLEGFSIEHVKSFFFNEELAKEFYQQHKDRSFFPDLIRYMTSGLNVGIVAEVKSIEEAREIVGATNPVLAKSYTIRYLFGKNIEENAIHCSDSVEAGEREVNFFLNKI